MLRSSYFINFLQSMTNPLNANANAKSVLWNRLEMFIILTVDTFYYSDYTNNNQLSLREANILIFMIRLEQDRHSHTERERDRELWRSSKDFAPIFFFFDHLARQTISMNKIEKLVGEFEWRALAEFGWKLDAVWH